MATIPWDEVIDIAVTIIKSCLSRDSAKNVRARLRNPGPRERAAFRRQLSKRGLKGTELREEVDKAMDELRHASSSQITDLIQQAKQA